MAESDVVESYWRAYAETLADPAGAGDYVAERFGDSPEMADELGGLIVSGRKTATCSALWEWEAEGKAVPAVGLKTVVLDGAGSPLCVIETTEVSVVPFDEVGAEFARDEGEGDLSLAYWREAHWRFFERALPKLGREPGAKMPLVCERFRLVYR